MRALAGRSWTRIGLWSAGIGYLLFLHIFVGVLLLKTNFLHLVGKTLGRIPPDEWSLPLCLNVLEQAEADARVPRGAVVLLGDSIIAELDRTEIGRDVVNFGLGGDTTKTLYSRLAALHSVAQSGEVVVGVGVNDLKYRAVSQIARDYARVLDRLVAVPRVLVLSVLPIDDAGQAARELPYLRNRNIQALNGDLRTLCEQRTNCRFLDAWPAVSAATEDVYGGDGWHLSAAGRHVLADFLRNALMSR
ncbi:MAG: hypothetical protein J2P47_00460 [Acetobacteraceae bacterium]|nr:hypothetical protein [Acetobacteraceae bacterium]